MNKIGIYYAYWEHNWAADLLSYPQRVARLGFEILEIKLSVVLAMTERQRRKLKHEAQAHGIGLTFCEALDSQIDISSPRPATRKRGIEYLKRGLDTVHKMGGYLLGGILYGAWNLPAVEGMHKAERLMWSVESMRHVLKTAEDVGVICAIEPVNRFEQFMLNTCAEALEYIKMVESPNLGILLDTFHMNIEEDDIYKAIVSAGKNLVHMHVGEPNRKLPGQGRFPWQELLRALRFINYEGAIVMEPFVQVGGEIGLDIKVWRDLARGQDLDEAAQQSLRFLRALLKLSEF